VPDLRAVARNSVREKSPNLRGRPARRLEATLAVPVRSLVKHQDAAAILPPDAAVAPLPHILALRQVRCHGAEVSETLVPWNILGYKRAKTRRTSRASSKFLASPA
jgi:hypothetical protein